MNCATPVHIKEHQELVISGAVYCGVPHTHIVIWAHKAPAIITIHERSRATLSAIQPVFHFECHFIFQHTHMENQYAKERSNQGEMISTNSCAVGFYHVCISCALLQDMFPSLSFFFSILCYLSFPNREGVAGCATRTPTSPVYRINKKKKEIHPPRKRSNGSRDIGSNSKTVAGALSASRERNRRATEQIPRNSQLHS